MILDPGYTLTLRPMRYPIFYEMYQAAIKNTWTVEEVDFSSDVMDLKTRLTLPNNLHMRFIILTRLIFKLNHAP